MNATKRRPIRHEIRSDEWVSEDPGSYIRRLRGLCRTARQRSWPGEPHAIAYVLGSEATRHDPVMLEHLRDHCREWIQAQLAVGKTVFDPMWQVYNLTVRALEQIAAEGGTP